MNKSMSGRTLRVALSIVVIGMANTAAADSFFSQWLPTSKLAIAGNTAAKPISQRPAKPPVRQAPTKPNVVKGELIYVVCSDDGGARVRGEDLKSLAFNAEQHETLKPFQGWGENKKVVNVGNEKLNFIRVQFDSSENRSTKTGWIAEKFVKLKSQCPGASTTADFSGSEAQVASLTSENCCRFPITHVPHESYLSGERMFGALRGKGFRIHAASDLYGKYNEPILSVAPGKVIRGLYEFYDGTYALDVKHQGGFIVRYGEISGKRTKTSSTGVSVKMGQQIAHMGKLTVRPPMLHFELYRGNSNSALNTKTTRKNRFGRRGDLMDPTKHLQRWEKRAF